MFLGPRGQCVPGEHGDAEVARDCLADRLVAAELEPQFRREPMAPEMRIDGHARPRALLAQDEPPTREVRELEPPPRGERMSARCDRNQRIRKERDLGDPEVPGWRRHHVQVIAVVTQPRHHAVPVQHLERDFDVGVGRAERAEQPGHEVLRGAHHGDAEPPARQPVHRIDALLERTPLGRDRARGARELATRLGQLHATRDDVVERHADRAGDVAQLHRRRRLRDVHAPGRRAHAAGLGQRQEQAQLPECHIHR